MRPAKLAVSPKMADFVSAKQSLISSSGKVDPIQRGQKLA
jgi:hypothetical protein